MYLYLFQSAVRKLGYDQFCMRRKVSKLQVFIYCNLLMLLRITMYINTKLATGMWHLVLIMDGR